MEESAFAEIAKDFIKNNILVLGIFFIGLILFSVGVIQLFGAKNADISFKSGQDIVEKSDAEGKKIMVDISGAVVAPGLYSLPFDARVQDALVISGGLSAEADREYVSKAINLAQKLTDGQKLYLPKAGEKGVAGSVRGAQIYNDGKIHINSASVSELDTLSGVGKVTAQKIIDSRPYSKIDELVTKKAVSQKVFESIKDKIDL